MSTSILVLISSCWVPNADPKLKLMLKGLITKRSGILESCRFPFLRCKGLIAQCFLNNCSNLRHWQSGYEATAFFRHWQILQSKIFLLYITSVPFTPTVIYLYIHCPYRTCIYKVKHKNGHQIFFRCIALLLVQPVRSSKSSAVSMTIHTSALETDYLNVHTVPTPQGYSAWVESVNAGY